MKKKYFNAMAEISQVLSDFKKVCTGDSKEAVLTFLSLSNSLMENKRPVRKSKCLELKGALL